MFVIATLAIQISLSMLPLHQTLHDGYVEKQCIYQQTEKGIVNLSEYTYGGLPCVLVIRDVIPECQASYEMTVLDI